MKPAFRWAGIVLLLVLASLADDKKKQQAYYVRPDQVVDLDSPKLVMAKQKCENWAVAAGLEAMLQQQNARIEQNFWVMRVYGGELCVDEIPSIDTLSGEVNREFVLDDGRHVRLELHYSPGTPTNTDALIFGLKQQQLSLIFLRGHPFYLTGATYDEHIGRDGSRMYVIKELRMANTFPQQPGIAFVSGRDNMDDIQGIMNLSVSEVSR
jgi:hypothetical protein